MEKVLIRIDFNPNGIVLLDWNRCHREHWKALSPLSCQLYWDGKPPNGQKAHKLEAPLLHAK